MAAPIDLGAWPDREAAWPIQPIGGVKNNQLDYPINFQALVLDDNPDTYVGNGVIYIDNLASITGTLATPAPKPTPKEPPPPPPPTETPPEETSADPIIPISPASVGTLSLSPTSLDFGQQQVDTTSASQMITIKNTGQGVLEIKDTTIGGAQPRSFQLGANRCADRELSPNQSCTIRVRFKPTGEGGQSANLVIENNAGNGPQSVTLRGAGAVAIMTLMPTSLTFGDLATGETKYTRIITVKNTGNGVLKLTSVVLSGAHKDDFRVTNNKCTEKSLTPDKTCTISIRFIVNVLNKERKAKLVISSNASNSPQTVPLTGFEYGGE
jgi:hypothetical protein